MGANWGTRIDSFPRSGTRVVAVEPLDQMGHKAHEAILLIFSRGVSHSEVSLKTRYVARGEISRVSRASDYVEPVIDCRAFPRAALQQFPLKTQAMGYKLE